MDLNLNFKACVKPLCFLAANWAEKGTKSEPEPKRDLATLMSRYFVSELDKGHKQE